MLTVSLLTAWDEVCNVLPQRIKQWINSEVVCVLVTQHSQAHTASVKAAINISKAANPQYYKSQKTTHD